MSTPFRGRYSPASRGGTGGGSGGRGGSNTSRGGGGGGGGGRGQYARGGRGDGSRSGFTRGRGGDGRGGGGGFHGGRGGHGEREPPAKKESILNLEQYLNRAIYVKFNGGREVSGVLKGFDPLLNMVLDEAQEKMRNADGEIRERTLGLAVIRGTHITTLHPVDGSESIANPYLAAAEDGADGKVTPAYQYAGKSEEESE